MLPVRIAPMNNYRLQHVFFHGSPITARGRSEAVEAAKSMTQLVERALQFIVGLHDDTETRPEIAHGVEVLSDLRLKNGSSSS